MSFSTLPLSYCTNVHPGQTVDEVVDGLVQYTAPMQHKLGRPVAAGLWLARSVIDGLEADPRGLEKLQGTLTEQNLVCYTLNTFPYGELSQRAREGAGLRSRLDLRRSAALHASVCPRAG